MKRQFPIGDPDVFDLAWLDDEELRKLQEAMLSSCENDICAYWLHCLNERWRFALTNFALFPGRGQEPDFKQYPISVLHAAKLIFGAIGSDFKAIGKPIAQRFCEMLVQCCEGTVDRAQAESLHI